MKSIHYIIYIAFAALSFTACQEDEFFADYGEGTGTLTLSGIEVVSEVGDIQTRASMNDADIPSADEFTIELLDANTQEFVQELELDKRYTLEAGSYIIKASCGEECVISATPYFCGERKLTIADGDAKTITISPSLCCAIIQPRIAEDLAAQYESYTLTIIGNVDGEEPESATLTSGEDFYLACGEDKTYSLTLAGKNKLGKEVSHTWTYSDLAERTRYIVNCNPDLPSFSLPEQAETNAWSKFIYVTPVTAADFSYVPEGMTADEILANMVYEVSADGQTWNPAITDDDKIVFTGLTPSTEYTIRARFGGVNNDNPVPVKLTTESAQELVYGGLEEWTSNELYGGNGTFSAKVYCDYCTGWATRNERTTLGAEDASGGIGGFIPINGNYGAAWRWHSGTVSTDDRTEGEKAAEISTLAFYNEKLNGSYDRDDIHNRVKGNGTPYVGYLLLGSYNVSSDTYDLGVDHLARPVSISFDYKYVPVTGDQAIMYAKLYDENKNEIASTEEFKSDAQDEYVNKPLQFIYTNYETKAKYIGVFFQSGTDVDINKMKLVEGSYNVSPYNQDRVVGSVLKIDNVVLNYDYE